MNISSLTIYDLLGGVLLLIGIILFLAGTGIVDIKQIITVSKGKGAIIIGLLFIIVGVILLVPRTGAPPKQDLVVTKIPISATTQTTVDQPQGTVGCLSSDYIPPLGGIYPPIESLICIPTGIVGWISSDPAQFNIQGIYNNTFNTGFTIVLFGPVKFTISGVKSNNVRLDSRTDASLAGNFDGKSLNLVYRDGKVCDYAAYTGSACP